MLLRFPSGRQGGKMLMPNETSEKAGNLGGICELGTAIKMVNICRGL